MKIDQCTVTLTRKCNLRCSFCYAKKAGYNETSTIKYDDLKKIVDFCSDAKLKYIIFSGGEPTLYPKLIEILKYIKNKQHKILPTIATNGIRLEDMDYCGSLIENGISYIDISLKGKDSNECCKIVGSDCYLQQIKAIRNLAALSIDFTCSMVLTAYNINSLCDTVRNACNNGAKQFSFTFIIDNEQSKERDKLYLIKNDPIAMIRSFFSQIDELNSITKEWWIEYSFPMCFYTQEQLSILKGKLAYPCQVHTERGIIFDIDMNLIPCSMYFEEKIGQLGVDFSSYKGFEETVKKPIYRTKIDQLNRLPSLACKQCEHLESCYGGCPVIWKNYSFEAITKFKEEYYG